MPGSRRRPQLLAPTGPVQRLYAHRVSGRDESVGVPRHEQGEHARQPLQGAGAVLLDQVERHLVVGGAGEHHVTQVAAQVPVVVDLAVAHEVKTAVFGGQGLATAAGVDYGQAPVAEPRRREGDSSLAVRPAVLQAAEHPQPRARVLLPVDPNDAAHADLHP